MAVTPEPLRLTNLSHGAGCACKIGQADLGALLGLLPRPDSPDLLVGADSSDDAAVYRLHDDLAVVASADFFTPIVDDPYDFGRIAATNALSDIYAMGAEPILALNLLAFSTEALSRELVGEILRGGAEVARAAGVALAGGHTIDDPEPKYGLAVVGVVDPERMLRNSGGKPGDLLFLTKPLGVGLVTTAAKRGLASEELVARAIDVMCELNAPASRQALLCGAHAATDVTGFGLLGHLHELCDASGLEAGIQADSVTAIEGALTLAGDERCIAGGSRRNAEYARGFVDFAEGISAQRRVLLADAMTSGGLLIAVPPDRAERAPGFQIGRLERGEPGRLTLVESGTR